jgi:hypothetical protein
MLHSDDNVGRSSRSFRQHNLQTGPTPEPWQEVPHHERNGRAQGKPGLVIVFQSATMGASPLEPPMTHRLRLFSSALALMAGLLHPILGHAAEADRALVLAVDISNSMDPEEQELQRQGFVEAFRSPLVHNAIRNGMLGRVAVTYMEWAHSTIHHVVVPWTEIETAEDAVSFADRLAGALIRRSPRTSISGAIDFSVGLLAQR